jgi:signal transduction histidine kinase
VVVALLLTLGLSAALALNAAVTAHYHRATAERVLQDYAVLAADQFSDRLNTRLATQLYPILALIASHGGSAGDGHLESRDRLIPELNGYSRATLAQAGELFRIDRIAGTVTVESPAPGDADRRALRDSVVGHAATRLDKDAYFGIVRVASAPATLAVYAASRDSTTPGHFLYGFTIPDSVMLAPIRGVLQFNPLLPPSLVHGLAPDSMVGILVTTGDGGSLLERRFDRSSPFRASRAMSKSAEVIQVRVSLTKELAPLLIIGGLPRSQLPLLVGLLVVTSLLVVTAVMQLRRERAFASLREDFVSGVSHELRTPLAQIRLFSETLKLGRVRTEAERQRSLAIVDQEARRLVHLVDNLLHFSRTERGGVQIAREPTALGRLITDIVELFRPIAAARRVSIVLSAAQELEMDVQVAVDPNAFRQILLNLLDNALKYGPDGQVITVGAAREGAEMVITVADEGPGVPAAARERIWDRFWRDERARSSSVVGTGIGLAIVRELVTLHGGRYLVGDAQGGGARFEIRLPA